MKNSLLFLKRYLKRIKVEYRKSFAVSFGVFLIIFIVLFIFISRFVTANSRKTENELKLIEKQIEYRSSLMERKDRFEKQLEDLKNKWDFLKNRIFSDNSDDLAFSNMQQIIDQLSNMMNITIKSFKFEQARKMGDFSILPVSLEFSTKYEDLISFLYAIETHKNYLKISDIEIINLPQNENFTVRTIVEGYRYYENK